MSEISYIQASELMVGENHATLTDTLNRALKQVLSDSSLDPDGVFPGFVAKSASTVYANAYTGDFSDKINAAIAGLPSNGGIVDATDLDGAQYMSSNIAVTKPSVYIKFGNAVVYMGANKITVASTAAGFHMEGITPYAFNQAIGSSGGTFFYSTGDNCPFEIGDTSGSAPLYGIKLANFAIYCGGSGNTTNCVGLWLRKVLFGVVSELYINVGTANTNQLCLRVDGTGFFSANLRFQNLALVGAGGGMHFTGGAGVDATNACVVDGGNYAGDGVNSIGILIDSDCNGNRFDNIDIEGCLVGIKCTGTSSGNFFEGRVESNTTDAYFGTNSKRNWFKMSHGDVPITATDLNGTNTVLGPTKLTFGTLGQFPNVILPHGAVPSGIVDGQIWTTTSGMFVRINGVTKTVTLT